MEAQRQAEQSRQFGSSQGMEAQRQAEQSRQFGSNRQLQAQEAQDRANQFGANFGMDAQKQREASRQFGSTRQLQAQQEQERAKQFGANFGMDAQKQREQSRQYGADQRSRAEESAARERQFGANFGMDAQRQREQSRQFGATQRTQAEQSAAAERQFGANYSMDAQRQAEQSRQYAGNQRLSAAQSLNQFGTSQQQADMQRLNAQNAVGETQRGLDQTRLDTAYDDFQRQRDYPMDQLGRYAGIIQGLPMTPNKTMTQYGQAPSALAGLAGTAAAAYGGYKTFAAAGGEMRSYNNGGLVALAEGGVGGDVGGGDEKPIGDLGKQAKDLAVRMRGDSERIAGIPGLDPLLKALTLAEVERAMKAPQAPPNTVFQELVNKSQAPQGLASIAPQQPPMDPTQSQQPPPPTMTAANGGLMNINLPDDYYDEDSYAHGGIAHFTPGGSVQEKENQRLEGIRALSTQNKSFLLKNSAPPPAEMSLRKVRLIMAIHRQAMINGKVLQTDDLEKLSEPELEAVAAGKKIPEIPSTLFGGNVELDENSFAPTINLGNRQEQPAGLPQPSAPQGLAQIQEVDMSTMPTRREAPVDYMAKAKELYAGVPSGAMTDEEMAKDKEQRKYEALMQFGLNLAGTKNSSFLGGVGEAGAATMPAIIEARTAQNAATATRKKEDRDMKIAQIQTALGLEKDDAEKVFKQQELALKTQELVLKKQEGLDRSKLTAAQIDNLGKPDNIYDLMESNPAVATRLIAIQNAKDLTPTARAGLIKSLIESVTDPKQKADLQNIAMSMVLGGETDTTEEESGVLRRYGLQ